MSINHLPVEIILMIFRIHLYLHLESRHPLLLTCRLWYNVAINCSYIWEKISWPQITHGIFAISCPNFQSLAHIVERTGKSLDLLLSTGYVRTQEVDEFITSVDPNWLSGCRSLGLRPHSSGDVLDKLLRHTNFQSLECLSLYGVETSGYETLAGVIAQIDRTAPHIKKLGVDMGVLLQLISLHSSILGRISSLIIFSQDRLPRFTIPWSQLVNLRHLRISQHLSGPPVLGLRHLAAPFLASLHLDGDLAPGDFFSDEVMQRITHLVLENFERNWENVFKSALPELTYLAIKQQGKAVDWVQAEKLEELLVIFTGDSLDSLSFFEAKVTPRVLRVKTEEVECLDNPGYIDTVGFDENIPIWSRLEELHITFFYGIRHLGRVFTRTLLGDEDLEPCYPKLSCLTIRYSNYGKSDLSQAEKLEKVDELLAIKKKREGVGLARITKLEVGWHWIRLSHPTIGDRSPEPWMTEWRDCLQNQQL